MKLRFRDVERERRLELEETIPIAQLPLTTPDRPVLLDPVPVKLTAEFADGTAQISVEAEARHHVLRRWCREAFHVWVTTVFDIEAVPDEDDIVLVDEVRQHILLALPSHTLCSTGCRGLCSVCGANRNVHPCGCAAAGKTSPFDALKNFKIK